MEPAMGFTGKIKITFTDDRRLPEANTCALQLNLCRCYTTYDAFREELDFSILNSYGFGRV